MTSPDVLSMLPKPLSVDNAVGILLMRLLAKLSTYRSQELHKKGKCLGQIVGTVPAAWLTTLILLGFRSVRYHSRKYCE